MLEERESGRPTCRLSRSASSENRTPLVLAGEGGDPSEPLPPAEAKAEAEPGVAGGEAAEARMAPPPPPARSGSRPGFCRSAALPLVPLGPALPAEALMAARAASWHSRVVQGCPWCVCCMVRGSCP